MLILFPRPRVATFPHILIGHFFLGTTKLGFGPPKNPSPKATCELCSADETLGILGIRAFNRIWQRVLSTLAEDQNSNKGWGPEDQLKNHGLHVIVYDWNERAPNFGCIWLYFKLY